MQIFIIISAFGFFHSAFSQNIDDYAKMKQTKKLLDQKKISIRHIISHDGFIVHYNCDSIPFLKKVIKDTIKIWTESGNFAMDPHDIDKYASKKEFGETVYIKNILPDGRIVVSGMHQTVFIFRNDSLFEIKSGFEKKGPKLIFHPKMFVNGRSRIKLYKKNNYLGDEIILEQTWLKKGKKCYVIRINNKYDKWDTTYSYAFDEDIHFLYWEDCDD